MAALSEWLLSFRPQPERMTAEDYESLPEDVSKTIEIVGGYVVHCESPARDHQRAVYRLQRLIERHARSAMERGHDCIEFDFDVDLRLHDIPLTIRRPDVVLYRCLDRENKERLRAEHALLVVEVISPGSELQDTADKHAEYARAGIPHYWIVRLDATGVSVIEQYQLDQATGCYKHIGTLMKHEAGGPPVVPAPIPITVDWAALEY
ncbi:Uma2 family endonuclease [Actinomadura sp. 7K507]|uniref:Uma2 family endonuclease n=1 Tax=Actinomadura sp. 7K507 TaxID=2530365 RepID=UPI00104DC59C|nr:Uma2 family endonuclease [Actinomadura sp. 7K507]TDC87562.1 Uma2 family endonuclease [Actinomadura sp. 7K507]